MWFLIANLSMATIKQLIDKNKSALERQYYIECISLSYILIVKALKQVIKEERILVKNPQPKLNNYVKILKAHFQKNPIFKKKLKKNVYRQIAAFSENHKVVMRELKYQYPEVKLKNLAKNGINIIIQLNTTLVKLKSNKL